MILRYTPHILQATRDLINAINHGERQRAAEAIQRGADVNCRIIQIDDRQDIIAYRVAEDHELLIKNVEYQKSCAWISQSQAAHDVVYEVPMVDTTTLLNIVSKRAIQNKDNQIGLAQLLMANGAELGAIDYAGYWKGWGKFAPNYFQNTPLLNAIAEEQLDFALLYMQFLTRLDEDKRRQILNYKDQFCAGFHTALEFAIRRGFSQLATQIVRAGADPNPQPFIYAYAGQSPLHMACMMLGQSRLKDKWDINLGSDFELVIALLEYGANFNLTVSTEVFRGYRKAMGLSVPIWEKVEIAAFDHIDVQWDSLSLSRPFDYVSACNAAAFSPVQEGQIKHPFHEEYSFRSRLAQRLIASKSRSKYLASDHYQRTDKVILQQAILKRIIHDFLNTHNEQDPFLRNLDIHSMEVQTVVDILLQHAQNDHFKAQLQYGGILYNADKEARTLILPPDENNPLLHPKLKNKLLHLSSNNATALQISVTDRLELEPLPAVSASLLLKILSHPVTKVMGAIVLFAGIAGIILGSCGLAGVAVGISALLAKVFVGVGVGATVASAVGFFASSRVKPYEDFSFQPAR